MARDLQVLSSRNSASVCHNNKLRGSKPAYSKTPKIPVFVIRPSILIIIPFRFGYPQKQKASTFQLRLSLLSSTIIKRLFQPFGLHTRSLTNSFVCNFLSSSVPRLIAAFLSFSDPRCFHFRFRLLGFESLSFQISPVRPAFPPRTFIRQHIVFP